MGHATTKDVYRTLVDQLDGSMVRMPDHAALRTLLMELYSREEAELVARMPWGLSRLDRLSDLFGEDREMLRPKLDALADKGLVLDLMRDATGQRYYVPSPFVIGIYEFTMMRAGPHADHARRARLFHEYLATGAFYRENFGDGQQVFIARALPHDGTLEPSTEILDADRITSIIEGAERFAVGTCSCRHEREHLGRRCSTPLETCTAMDAAAEYLVQHRMARPMERSEMHELVAQSREGGLVLCADNVQHGVSFICHCCGCCCNLLRGMTEHGYSNVVTTAPFAPRTEPSKCNGCGRCVAACPIGALSGARPAKGTERPLLPGLDRARCIGCGVCVTRCRQGALRLEPGTRRRIAPEDTFERVLLQSLERGTLQNLVFDEPSNRTHSALRALLGGVLRLSPVKRLLLGDALRSRFVRAMAALAGDR